MRTRAAALTLLLGLTVTGCSGAHRDGVDPARATESDFAGGTCLVLAADVLALRTLAVETLKQEPTTGTVTFADRDYLRAAGDRLREGLPRAGSALADPLRELVAATDAEATLAAGDDAAGVRALNRLRAASEAVTAVCT